MKRSKIIAQLESQRASIKKAMADEPIEYLLTETATFYDGYWRGALFHNTEALTLLKGKELDHG
jgi:hypothetical protein